jgi:hypothetical protein
MTQADSVHSTPPTNTSALPVDPTRRRILTIATGGAVAAVASAPAIAIAAPVRPDTTKAGPVLRAALVAMNEANDALMAANAVLEAGVATVNQWEEENPRPTSNSGKRRWWKKYRAYSEATTEKLWDAVVDAEQDFKAAQVTLAKVKPED